MFFGDKALEYFHELSPFVAYVTTENYIEIYGTFNFNFYQKYVTMIFKVRWTSSLKIRALIEFRGNNFMVLLYYWIIPGITKVGQ